jgi:uncharacterized protein YjeT (DUF2065 family)
MPEVRPDRRKRASSLEKEVSKGRRPRVAGHIQTLGSLMTAKSRVIRGVQLMARVTGLSPTTILRGCNELKADLADCPDQHLRTSGGGRPAAEVKDPRLEDTLEAILTSETAGDPMGRRPKAKRSSLRRLSAVLKTKGHPASRPTVAKLLRKLDYSPKVNARRVEARGATPAKRNKQFEHIGKQREEFAATGDPIISVDTKKKNLSATSRTLDASGASQPSQCWRMTGRRIRLAEQSHTGYMKSPQISVMSVSVTALTHRVSQWMRLPIGGADMALGTIVMLSDY